MGLILVTGGAGFIGSHLCEALLARGERVRVLDDLSTGRRENLPRDVELIVGDVADPETVREVARGVDAIIHLAAIASVERCTKEWLSAHRVNLGGSIAVFDAARTASKGRPVPVVYASSAAVYGEQQRLPISEDAPCRPLSAYGADKLGSELHARVAGAVHGVPTIGLRFFNVYGPHQDPRSPYSGVISLFCGRIARGEPLLIHGDGEQTRDFIFVGDVVAGILAALKRACVSAPVLNLCSGSATSINDLAATLLALSGASVSLHHGPPRPGEIRHSLGDRSRAAAMLALAPPRPLSEGLACVLTWLGLGRERTTQPPSAVPSG